MTKTVSLWRDIGASPQVLEWLVSGVTFNFHTLPTPFEEGNSISGERRIKFTDDQIIALLAKEAISVSHQKPICISGLGCVPKKKDKLRLICKLNKLNKFLKCPYFKHDSIDVVLDFVESGDELVTIDLQDGFHHFTIAAEFRKYLGFCWKKTYYTWNVLPFGLCLSPYFFNKILRPVIQYLRVQGLRINLFVDDFLLAAQKQHIVQNRDFVLATLTNLGLAVNFEKSSLDPSSTKEYIGYVICTDDKLDKPWIRIPARRIYKLKRDIRRALVSKSVTARFLAKICGQCISFAKAILPTKLLLRNLYRLLSSRKDWGDILVLDASSAKDLNWWLSAIDNWNGRPVVKQNIDVQIFTDSSNSGWGAVCGSLKAAGLWDETVSYQHINYKELFAVLLAIKSFANCDKIAPKKTVQIVSDNICTVAYLNHLGGPVKSLSDLARVIHTTATEMGITLVAKHLSGILNTEADYLSRVSPYSTYSWSIHPAIFRQVDRMWGPHSCDRFADATNHLLPVYNSLFFDPFTDGVDALAQTNWGQHNNFVNAPFKLIPKILDIIVAQKADATIIAPTWPSQMWFHRLKQLAIRSPLRLPKSDLMWIQGLHPEPLKNPRWNLMAWRVSGKLGF